MRRRRAERGADRATSTSRRSSSRSERSRCFAASRKGSRRRGQLHRVSAAVSSRSARAISGASSRRSCRCSSSSLAGLRRAAASIGRRPRAGTRSASRRPARATRDSRSRGASASSICCPGLVVERRGDHLRRASRAGEVGRGTGYELDAITAVVLGGTSVFGGRGTLWGTLLGLFALSVLRNGLHLAALPSELTGVLTGALLLATIAIDRCVPCALGHVYSPGRAAGSREDARFRRRGLDVKNSRSPSCARDHRGSLIVAGTNVWLVRSLAPRRATRLRQPARRRPRRRRDGRSIAMMPKAKGDPYFVSCRAGAEEAAQRARRRADLGRPDGPRCGQAERARRELDHAQGRRDCRRGREPRRHLDRAAQGARARHQGADVGRRRRARRARFLRQPGDAEGIGNTLTDEAARLLGGKGEFAIITGALSAANQNEWIAFIKKRLAEKYPGPEAGDDPSERRRPRQGVRRDADDPARVSVGEAGDGDLGAGRARRRPKPCGRRAATTST